MLRLEAGRGNATRAMVGRRKAECFREVAMCVGGVVLEQVVEAEVGSVVAASEEALGAGPPLLVLQVVAEALLGLPRQLSLR
jgi:hypothetical protein